MYETVKHKIEAQEHRDSSKRGVLQQVIYSEVGTRGFNVQLYPSQRRIPLPTEPVAIIHGDGKQNGVDEEMVYDVVHGDVDQ